MLWLYVSQRSGGVGCCDSTYPGVERPCRAPAADLYLRSAASAAGALWPYERRGARSADSPSGPPARL